MSNPSFIVERLTGRDNYNSWSFAMMNLLKHEELWEAVVPIEGVVVNAAEAARKDSKAQAKINLMVHRDLYCHVRTATTAKEAWDTLKNLFQDDGLDRRVGLVCQLVNTKLCTCKNMEEYVSSIMTICQKLTEAGLVVTDEWTGIFMLAGLPNEFKPMVMSMESSGKKITADAVKSKLLQDVNLHDEDDIALVTKNRYKQKKKNFHKKNFHGNGNNNDHFNNKKGKGKSFISVLSTGKPQIQDGAWYIDSGATSHMSHNRDGFKNFKSYTDEVDTAGAEKIKVTGVGSVNLNIYDENGDPSNINVDDVLYVPNLAANLLSVKVITQKGFKVTFEKDTCTILDDEGEFMAKAVLSGGLYKLSQPPSKKIFVAKTQSDINLWHRRMGHTNVQYLKKLKQGIVTGIDFKESNLKDCVVCAKGKQSKIPFNHEGTRASELLELIHSDLCGPIETEGTRASRYFLTFICDKSRRIFVYVLQFKSQVLESFKDFKARVENQTGKRIKILRTDNGKEYVNNEMKKFLSKSGIEHQTTIPYTPEQNGLAERYNRTIVEKTRCLLFDAQLPKSFWAEAVQTAVYLINRSPTSGHDITPEEAFTGKKPSLSHIHVFGTKCMAQIPKQRRKKLDPKSQEAILVGFGSQIKGYHLYSPQSQKFFYSRNVTFLDEATLGSGLTAKGDSLKKFVEHNTVCLDLLNNVPDEPKTVPQVVQNLDEQDDEEDIFEFVDTLEEVLLTDDESDDTIVEEVQPQPIRQSNRLKNQIPKNYNEKFLSKTHSNNVVMLSNGHKSNVSRRDQESGTITAPSISHKSGGGRDITGKSPKLIKEMFRSFLKSFKTQQLHSNSVSNPNFPDNKSQF